MAAATARCAPRAPRGGWPARCDATLFEISVFIRRGRMLLDAMTLYTCHSTEPSLAQLPRVGARMWPRIICPSLKRPRAAWRKTLAASL